MRKKTAQIDLKPGNESLNQKLELHYWAEIHNSTDIALFCHISGQSNSRPEYKFWTEMKLVRGFYSSSKRCPNGNLSVKMKYDLKLGAITRTWPAYLARTSEKRYQYSLMCIWGIPVAVLMRNWFLNFRDNASWSQSALDSGTCGIFLEKTAFASWTTGKDGLYGSNMSSTFWWKGRVMEENDASKVNNGARLVQIHEAGGNKIQGLGHAKNRISKVLTNIMSRFQHLVSSVSHSLEEENVCGKTITAWCRSGPKRD